MMWRVTMGFFPKSGKRPSSLGTPNFTELGNLLDLKFQCIKDLDEKGKELATHLAWINITGSCDSHLCKFLSMGILFLFFFADNHVLQEVCCRVIICWPVNPGVAAENSKVTKKNSICLCKLINNGSETIRTSYTERQSSFFCVYLRAQIAQGSK
jgi:hypothetical protein